MSRRKRLPTARTLVLAALFLQPGAFAGPQVLGVSPEAQTLSADILTDITVLFDTAIDPSTVNASTFMISGRWSGIPSGTFSLENGDALVRFSPSEPFSAGEWVTVSLSRGVKSEFGESLDKGYAWNFWTSSAPGTMDLTEIDVISTREPGEQHIQTYGAHAADMDNDGWTDLTLPNELSNDVRVFLNDGGGGYDSFEIHPIPNGSYASANEAVDMDGDGDFDFVVGNGGNNQLCVLIGNGTGGFESATSYTAGSSVRGVAALDLEGDGDMDIVTANRNSGNLSFFKNKGDGILDPAIFLDGNGSQETACAAADANNDGILDLFVGAYGSREMILLLGDGNGGLVFSSKVNCGGQSWMIAVGDVDGDGNVDVVSANSSDNNAGVILGDGAGGLTPAVTYPVGSFALAIDLGDLDGDGDLDLVTSNYGSGDWTLYENDGTGVFGNPRTLDAGSSGSCATLHDRDNDGDLDMTGIDETDDLLFIFENDMPVSVADDGSRPSEFRLEQNYPNPFNPTTEIGYRITETEHVSLRIFDMLGREVATLVEEKQDAGFRETGWDATGQPSGVYIYQLRAGNQVETRRMVLLR